MAQQAMQRVRVCSLGWIVAGAAGWVVLGASAVQAAPPPPPPPAKNPPPPKPAAPAALEQLGRALFNDATLSNPQGTSCSTCHAPQAGWAFPNSNINAQFGPVPGAVPGRFGNRRPPTISYASFMTQGPPKFESALFSYVGGFFYDGRAATLTAQIPGPLEGPNEMNNTPAGAVEAVANGPNAQLFKQVFDVDVTSLSTSEAFADITAAIVAFESSKALSPFNSRYDQYVEGKIELTDQEMAGLQLFTGSVTGRPGGKATAKQANCVVCHTIDATAGSTPDLFTSSTFNNTGTPQNAANPFYKQTSAKTDPLGYNPLGAAYIDYGLGDFLYPEVNLPSGNVGGNGEGDYLKINGQFKTPTLRNVDARPNAKFVKCYSHNGFFKSLEQIVHFYNTRNLTSVNGEVIDFTEKNPYAHLKGKPLWPAPENLNAETLVNPTGASTGLIGNLELTAAEEADLVAFLKTLTDAPPAR